MGGLYLLVLRVRPAVSLQIGALGRFDFAAGHYVYAGSAQRGLPARVERHLRADKPIRWHIDHLTSVPACQPLGAVLIDKPRLSECALNVKVSELMDATAPVPRFGASDCRQGCPAHLWRAPRSISLAVLKRALARMGVVSTINADADRREGAGR